MLGNVPLFNGYWIDQRSNEMFVQHTNYAVICICFDFCWGRLQPFLNVLEKWHNFFLNNDFAFSKNLRIKIIISYLIFALLQTRFFSLLADRFYKVVDKTRFKTNSYKNLENCHYQSCLKIAPTILLVHLKYLKF